MLSSSTANNRAPHAVTIKYQNNCLNTTEQQQETAQYCNSRTAEFAGGAGGPIVHYHSSHQHMAFIAAMWVEAWSLAWQCVCWPCFSSSVGEAATTTPAFLMPAIVPLLTPLASLQNSSSMQVCKPLLLLILTSSSLLQQSLLCCIPISLLKLLLAAADACHCCKQNIRELQSCFFSS